MASIIGTIATAQEVKARWAYSEMSSERFGKNYIGQTPAHLNKLSTSHASFSQVSQQDWPILVALIEIHGRNKVFVDNIDVHGAPQFICAAWDVLDLLNCWTLPTFGRVPYPAFLSRPPSTVAAGGVDDADPRYRAQGIPFDPKFIQSEPAIVIRPGLEMLLEGYLRSILWLRCNDPNMPFLVWLPHM